MNDEYVTDFISYKNAVLECRESHLASSENEPKLIYKDGEVVGVDSIYWGFVVATIGLNNIATDEDIDNLDYD